MGFTITYPYMYVMYFNHVHPCKPLLFSSSRSSFSVKNSSAMGLALSHYSGWSCRKKKLNKITINGTGNGWDLRHFRRVPPKCQTCNEYRLEHLNSANLPPDHKCRRDPASDKQNCPYRSKVRQHLIIFLSNVYRKY